MEKLFYGLSPENKAIVTDHLLEIKFDGDLSDYILKELKNGIISAQRTIENEKWTAPNVTPIIVPKESLAKIQIKREDDLIPKEMSKGVLVLGPAMFDGLQQWYRLQKFLDNAFGVREGVTSLDHFIQEFVRGNVVELKMQAYSKKLEKEEADAKTSKESA